MKANLKTNAIIVSLVIASCLSVKAEDFPKFPGKAIHFREVDRVNKGRYATCSLTVNTNGTFNGDFRAENMVAFAGCHIGGRLEFFDEQGNSLAVVKMPRLGLPIAFLAKEVERHADITGAIKPDQVSKLRTIKFTGFEDAHGTLTKDITEVMGFLHEFRAR